MAEARVDRLESALERLADAQARTDEQLGRVAEHLGEVAELLREVARRLSDHDTKIGDMQGMILEQGYAERAPAYFSAVLLKARPLRSQDVATLADDAEAGGAMTAAERLDLLRADVVVRGQWRGERTPAYLLAEVSVVADAHEVWRALRRAEVLNRATGVRPLAAVAGERILDDARDLARSRSVWVVLDGDTSAPA